MSDLLVHLLQLLKINIYDIKYLFEFWLRNKRLFGKDIILFSFFLGGQHYRCRLCNKPLAANGGADCAGPRSETGTCGQPCGMFKFILYLYPLYSGGFSCTYWYSLILSVSMRQPIVYCNGTYVKKNLNYDVFLSLNILENRSFRNTENLQFKKTEDSVLLNLFMRTNGKCNNFNASSTYLSRILLSIRTQYS